MGLDGETAVKVKSMEVKAAKLVKDNISKAQLELEQATKASQLSKTKAEDAKKQKVANAVAKAKLVLKKGKQAVEELKKKGKVEMQAARKAILKAEAKQAKDQAKAVLKQAEKAEAAL